MIVPPDRPRELFPRPESCANRGHGPPLHAACGPPPVIQPVSITRFPLTRFSPGAGLLRNPFVHRQWLRFSRGWVRKDGNLLTETRCIISSLPYSHRLFEFAKQGATCLQCHGQGRLHSRFSYARLQESRWHLSTHITYITYITLHYITLHQIRLYYITLWQYIQLGLALLTCRAKPPTRPRPDHECHTRVCVCVWVCGCSCARELVFVCLCVCMFVCLCVCVCVSVCFCVCLTLQQYAGLRRKRVYYITSQYVLVYDINTSVFILLLS